MTSEHKKEWNVIQKLGTRINLLVKRARSEKYNWPRQKQTVNNAPFIKEATGKDLKERLLPDELN